MPRQMPNKSNTSIEIGGVKVAAGERRTIDLSLGLNAAHSPWTLPVQVCHGRKPGPTMFVSAAIHGDEILGIEIIRRVLNSAMLRRIRGTLIAIPIVNGPGFLTHSRYLPDRRDLNRSFPGSEKGSMAARLADAFLNQVVAKSEFGIDLHTAALHRTNLPQIRVDAQASDKLRELADYFGAPVVIRSALRPGSLRESAKSLGVEVLLYEAGEALRFDEHAAKVGARGVLAVMQKVGMLPEKSLSRDNRKPIRALSSYWERAPEGGLFRMQRTIGDVVNAGDVLGVLDDPFGSFELPISAREDGVIIGRTNLPIVNQGDAVFHIGRTGTADAGSRLEAFADEIDRSTMFDEDEII